MSPEGAPEDIEVHSGEPDESEATGGQERLMGDVREVTAAQRIKKKCQKGGSA